MFTTPKKLKQQQQNLIDSKENNPHLKHCASSQNQNSNSNSNIPNLTSTNTMNTTTAITMSADGTAMVAASPSSKNKKTTIIFENGTMFGSISPDLGNKLSITSAANAASTQSIPISTSAYLSIPEIVISSSCSTNSLNRSRCELQQQQQPQQQQQQQQKPNIEESALESSSLLENSDHQEIDEHPDEFEQFILNRTTSDSNILDSSIYSELQFPPSIHGGNNSSGCGYLSSQGGGPPNSTTATNITQVAGPQTPPNSRQTKRTKRKHKTKSKCTTTAANLVAAAAAAGTDRASPTHYPPRYTAIFMDPHGPATQYGNIMPHHHHLHHAGAGVVGGNAANALGQIASAAASSPFLNGATVAAGEAAYMQQFQYFPHAQGAAMVPVMGAQSSGHHRHHRSLFEAATLSPSNGIENPLNPHANQASSPSTSATTASTVTPVLRLSFRKWFTRPSLPFIIGILALGGVACTLGGIVLGSTGLIEHSTQYLSAALLMIGIGVSLLVISGAIWRLSLPDDVDECPCYRHMEMCRNCNSPYCNSRLMGGSYLYPEFQHRPPPPSYLTSLNECAGMSLLFHPTATAQQAAYSTLRVNTPPPLYRSTNSLSVFGSSSTPADAHHATIVNAPCSTTVPNLQTSTMGIMQDHNALTMTTVMENLQAQTQPLIKEINYLELD